ncbi:hypothetical protein ScPMuIL_018138 [Solemya velum]
MAEKEEKSIRSVRSNTEKELEDISKKLDILISEVTSISNHLGRRSYSEKQELQEDFGKIKKSLAEGIPCSSIHGGIEDVQTNYNQQEAVATVGGEGPSGRERLAEESKSEDDQQNQQQMADTRGPSGRERLAEESKSEDDQQNQQQMADTRGPSGRERLAEESKSEDDQQNQQQMADTREMTIALVNKIKNIVEELVKQGKAEEIVPRLDEIREMTIAIKNVVEELVEQGKAEEIVPRLDEIRELVEQGKTKNIDKSIHIGTAGNVMTGEHASMTMSGDQHIGNTATREETKPEETVSPPTPPASGSTDSTPDIRPEMKTKGRFWLLRPLFVVLRGPIAKRGKLSKHPPVSSGSVSPQIGTAKDGSTLWKVAIAEGQDRRGGEESGAVGGAVGGVGSDEGVSESPELPVSRGPSEVSESPELPVSRGPSKVSESPELPVSRGQSKMWRRRPRLVNKFCMEGCSDIDDLCETDGECWVSGRTDEIRRVDVGGDVQTTRRVGEWCWGLTTDGTDLYVSCTDSYIYRLTRTDTPRTAVISPCPSGVRPEDRRVDRVTRSGDVTPLSHVKVRDATDVAVNRRGDMAVCDDKKGRVSVFTSDGLAAWTYPRQTLLQRWGFRKKTFCPRAVTCDSEGNFVVVDDDSITVLDRHGERVTSFTTTEDCDELPWSVSMAATGRLWVGFLGGHVCVYEVK